MCGLEKMVRLRGGLDIPGLNGMLAKLLLWSVSNTAFFLKAKPAFADFGVQLSKPSSYYFYSQMIESEVAPGLSEWRVWSEHQGSLIGLCNRWTSSLLTEKLVSKAKGICQYSRSA